MFKVSDRGRRPPHRPRRVDLRSAADVPRLAPRSLFLLQPKTLRSLLALPHFVPSPIHSLAILSLCLCPCPRCRRTPPSLSTPFSPSFRPAWTPFLYSLQASPASSFSSSLSLFPTNSSLFPLFSPCTPFRLTPIPFSAGLTTLPFPTGF